MRSDCAGRLRLARHCHEKSGAAAALRSEQAAPRPPLAAAAGKSFGAREDTPKKSRKNSTKYSRAAAEARPTERTLPPGLRGGQ